MGWKSVKTVGLNDMPNTEWWMDDDKFWIKKGKWRVKEDVPAILAHHREMIVNEIREKIEKKKEPGHVTVAVAGFTRTNLVNNVLNHVLELPCLKDSRWRW